MGGTRKQKKRQKGRRSSLTGISNNKAFDYRSKPKEPNQSRHDRTADFAWIYNQ